MFVVVARHMMAEATPESLKRASEIYMNNVHSLANYSYEDALKDAGIDRASTLLMTVKC